MNTNCTHQPQTPQKPAQSDTCQECGEQYSLRVCNTCGMWAAAIPAGVMLRSILMNS